MNNNWTWTYLNNCARDASAPTIPNGHHADLQGNHTASSWVFIKNFQLTSWCCYRSISRSNGLQNGSDIRCETANTTQWIQWKSVLQNTKHFYSRRGKDQFQRWLQHSREAYGLYRVDSVDRLQTDSMKTQKLMNHVRLPHFLEYQSKEFPRRRRENRGFSSFFVDLLFHGFSMIFLQKEGWIIMYLIGTCLETPKRRRSDSILVFFRINRLSFVMH